MEWICCIVILFLLSFLNTSTLEHENLSEHYHLVPQPGEKAILGKLLELWKSDLHLISP